MTRIRTLAGARLAVALAAALAVAACGRKGGLDLPPTANMPDNGAQVGTAQRADPASSLFNPAAGENPEPTAAKGRKRAFVLDPLLD